MVKTCLGEWRILRIGVPFKVSSSSRMWPACFSLFNSVYSCDLCEYRAASLRQVTMHRWAAHKKICNIRMHVADISCCPSSKVDFWSRPRLIKHLLETRIRSKHRTQSCRDHFMMHLPRVVDRETFDMLEARDREALRKARKDGHSHILATKPAKAYCNSILKGRENPAARKRRTEQGFPELERPRKRLRCKTNPKDMFYSIASTNGVQDPPKKRLRVKTPCDTLITQSTESAKK